MGEGVYLMPVAGSRRYITRCYAAGKDKQMRLPEFTADTSLAPSRGHYGARLTANVPGSITLQAQTTGCFCSEPDFRRVCTSPGHCYEQKVCLQWSCPGRGSEIDDDDLGGYFGLSPE